MPDQMGTALWQVSGLGVSVSFPGTDPISHLCCRAAHSTQRIEKKLPGTDSGLVHLLWLENAYFCQRSPLIKKKMK